MSGSTVQVMRDQWSNPTDISTILMIIGGDVVQKALAQGTGVWYFTPVCFSFGWVSYAFMALISIIGHGRLLPDPDYPAKVFNLKSGYARENKNWVVGRILRDVETSLSKKQPLGDDAIRISVYEAAVNRNGLTEFSLSLIHLNGLLCILMQLGLAAAPIALSGEWDIMLITAVGTLLVQMAGCVPQWRAEKLPNRQARDEVYALTQGNGSREIVVIFGMGNCLDIEEMAASGSPRGGRPWEKFTAKDIFSQPRNGPYGKAQLPRRDTQLRKARVSRGIPVGFWVTRIVVVAQSILWLLLLINVATSRNYNWVLLAIGTIGMFQNAYLAGMERPVRLRNLPLNHVDSIRAKKVMDGLMDFEVQYPGLAVPLREEFFPGHLRMSEREWWDGRRKLYDDEREKMEWRGTPRSRRPRIETINAMEESTESRLGQSQLSARGMPDMQKGAAASYPRSEAREPVDQSLIPLVDETSELPISSKKGYEHLQNSRKLNLQPPTRTQTPSARGQLDGWGSARLSTYNIEGAQHTGREKFLDSHTRTSRRNGSGEAERDWRYDMSMSVDWDDM